MSSNAAVYARANWWPDAPDQGVSRDSVPRLVDQQSIATQRLACEQYLRNMEGEDWRIVNDAWTDLAVFTDDASAVDLRGGSALPPGLSRMRNLARAHGIDAVICMSFDRLSVNTNVRTALMRDLADLGIRLISVTEGEHAPRGKAVASPAESSVIQEASAPRATS